MTTKRKLTNYRVVDVEIIHHYLLLCASVVQWIARLTMNLLA